MTTATAKKFDPAEYERTFDGLMERERAGSVTKPAKLGTVFELAIQGGWIAARVAGGGEASNDSDSNDEGGALGDIRAGRLYAKANREKLLYAGFRKSWLAWNGTYWEWSAKGEEVRAAKWVAGKALDHASAKFKADPDANRKLLAWAASLQNIKRLEAMIELTKSEEGMTAGHMSEIDANPWLLGVRNGVLDLKNGTLLTPDPKMLITRQAAAEFHRGAECPRWRAFLDSIFPDDPDTVAYIKRALGYTLTGSTTEEVMFICFGHGANGKSVFSNVVNTILASYAQTAPSSMLVVRGSGDTGASPETARQCGARYLGINETGQGDRLAEHVVKTVAGREPNAARFLYGDFFEFQPTAKAWLRTNHRPIVTGEDDGIWRRLHLIPFIRKFAEHERDPWLEQKLMDERDGILAWMVEGCLEWQRVGLKPSETVRRESLSYRKESDLLGEFLEDNTIAGPDARVEQGKLYTEWTSWNERNGTKAGSKASFSRKLNERGISASKSNGNRFYSGLVLKDGRP